MINYIWPIVLVVVSNTLYQICAKSVPGDMNPMASLTVTYTVAAVASLILFFVMNKDSTLLQEYSKLNWAPYVLGIVIVGLEVGMIYAYRAGWTISTASVVQYAFLSIVLIFVGALIYKDQLTWNKLVGVAACLGGVFLINMK